MRPIRFNFPRHTKAELIIDAHTDKEAAYEVKSIDSSRPYAVVAGKRVYLDKEEKDLLKRTIKK